MKLDTHRRSPSPRAATQCIVCCCVLRAAYGLATAHALLCIANGDDLAIFRFLSLVTLTFDLIIRTRARFLYNVPNRQV